MVERLAPASAACKDRAYEAIAMNLQAPGEVAREGIQRVWQGDLGLISEDYVDHNLPPGLPPGREGLGALYRLTLAGFPDFEVSIEQLVAEGDLVAVRLTNTGTNAGSFMGQPPTNKRATWTTMAIFRVADGKLVERWGIIDALSLFRQLGVRPPTPPPDSS